MRLLKWFAPLVRQLLLQTVGYCVCQTTEEFVHVYSVGCWCQSFFYECRSYRSTDSRWIGISFTWLANVFPLSIEIWLSAQTAFGTCSKIDTSLTQPIRIHLCLLRSLAICTSFGFAWNRANWNKLLYTHAHTYPYETHIISACFVWNITNWDILQLI